MTFLCIFEATNVIQSMQSESLQSTYRQYIDAEYLQVNQSNITVWYYFEVDRVVALYANLFDKRIVGFAYVEHPKVFDCSLSEIQGLLARFPKINPDKQIAVLVDKYYTVVPEPLYVAEKKEHIYKLVHPIAKYHEIYDSRNKGRVLLYAANEMFIRAIRMQISGVDVRHYFEDYLQSGFMQDTTSKNRLYVQLHADYIDVWCADRSKLLFHNTFSYESDTDVVYYLLSVAEALQISNDKLEVFISGRFTNQSTLLQLMKKYIPVVETAMRADIFEYAAAFRELQDHQYYFYLTQPLCASFLEI
jgi:hypothetical protein